MFFWAAMRYAEDFMPALMLLSIVGFWQSYRSLSGDRAERKWIAVLGAVLAGISIVIGAALGLSNYVTSGLL
jgi:uncharacterized BrkB/YihY/UPF0761 family membrane protein